jgi:hypothetical protein
VFSSHFIVDDVINFVERERIAAAAEEEQRRALSVDELVDRGDAVQGLRIVAVSPSALVFRCPLNESRLRIGDRVELSGSAGRFAATIAELRDNGCEVHLQMAQSVRDLDRGPWAARALPVDVSALVIACLKKLKPGAPGWSFFRICSGETRSITSPVSESIAERQSSIVAEILSSRSTDATQEAVFRRCLELPHTFAVQGPPGTGKTRVLALVAEGLARMGKRTLVVAPTHQAVNNALSAIRRCFPGRRTVKVGDELRRESLDPGVQCQLFEDGTRHSELPVSNDTITGMTFISALHHLILRKSALAPNVILIEEAGQLPLAHGVCAGLIGAGSVLLFGDDAQMPPVFPAAAADDPLADSFFARFKASQPGNVLMLQTTYRLNAELCNIIGRVFYPSSVGTTLRSSNDAASRRFPLVSGVLDRSSTVSEALGPDASFVWVRSPAGSDQQTNDIEARFVANLVQAVLEGGVSANQVAVVTPFRRQVALIRNLLQSHLSEGATLPIVDTVERVQGLTVELVVVSVCVSDPEYAGAQAAFLFSPNRLNVALSRARTKAILVAAPAILDISPAGSREALARWRRLVGMGRVVSMTSW